MDTCASELHPSKVQGSILLAPSLISTSFNVLHPIERQLLIDSIEEGMVILVMDVPEEACHQCAESHHIIQNLSLKSKMKKQMILLI